jgi:hypothetical protein
MNRERFVEGCARSRGIAVLRCRLSANSDGEERPRAGDDDESLRNAGYLLAACFAQPLGAPQPDRLCGVVELCPRWRHVVPSVSQHDLPERTDRVGCVRRYRCCHDRLGSGEAGCSAILCGRCVGWTRRNRHHQSRLSTFLGTSFVGSVGSPVLCSAI